MSNASVALRSARTYLNDINAVTWSDAVLMPLLQEAHGELQQELSANNTGRLKIQSPPIRVSALQTTLGIDQPSTIINPISMLEGDPGADPDFFQPMMKTTFVPMVDPSDWLLYWSWIGDIITFVGSTRDRSVILRYEGMITTPQSVNDSLGVIFAERFLGPRVAALAYSIIGRDNKYLLSLADKNLYTLVSSQVTDDQRPVRRRGYRSAKKLYGNIGLGSTPIGSPGGGSALPNWIKSSTVPDGIVTQFAFSFNPSGILWNGIEQFLGVGYTLVASSGQYLVTFTDVNGNVLTPQLQDDIRGAR